MGLLVVKRRFALRFRRRLFLFVDGFAGESRVDAVADFKSSGLNVGCGELADFFTGDFEICCSAIDAYGGEDGAGLDLPGAVGLNKNKVVQPLDGGDSPNETGVLIFFFSGRRCWGRFVCAGAEAEEREDNKA